MKIKTLVTIIFLAGIALIMSSCLEDLQPPNDVTATPLKNPDRVHIVWSAVSGAAKYTIGFKTELTIGFSGNPKIITTTKENSVLPTLNLPFLRQANKVC